MKREERRKGDEEGVDEEDNGENSVIASKSFLYFF